MCRRPMGTLPADDILRTAAGLSPAAFAAAALPVSSPFLISRSIDAASLQRGAPFELPQEQSVRSASDQVGSCASGCADHVNNRVPTLRPDVRNLGNNLTPQRSEIATAQQTTTHTTTTCVQTVVNKVQLPYHSQAATGLS